MIIRDEWAMRMINENKKLKENWIELKEFLIDYRFKMDGSFDDRRECVSLPIADILKKMDEIEEKM